MEDLIRELINFESISDENIKQFLISDITSNSTVLQSLTNEHFSNFVKNVSKKLWFEYVVHKDSDIIVNNYNIRVTDFLPDTIKKVIKYLINVKKFISQGNQNSWSEKDIEDNYRYIMYLNCSPPDIVSMFNRLLTIAPIIQDPLDSINQSFERGFNINISFYGRPLSGRDGFISSSRDFFSQLGEVTDTDNSFQINIREMSFEFNTTDTINSDNIIYTLDFSYPRLDITDIKYLEDFMRMMGENSGNLDYWKKVIIMCSKTEIIKLRDYERFGGLPKHKHTDESTIDQYNENYSKILFKAMKKWKDRIERRKFLKIYDSMISYDDGGQSFFACMKQMALILHPNIRPNTIDAIISKIPVIFINEESDSITPIPNFQINERFNHRKLDFMIKHNTLDSNWLRSIYNQIYYSFK